MRWLHIDHKNEILIQDNTLSEGVSEEVSDSETDFVDGTGSDIHTIQRYKRNTLTGIADIERFVEQSTTGTDVYKVYVDDTMTQLLITVISTKGIQLLNVTKPSGSVVKDIATVKKITKLSNGSSIVTYTLPISQPFYVGIQGIDHTGHIIQRIDPTLLEPITYMIDVYPDTGAKMYENSTLNITYTIQCYETRNIKVNINDTMGLIQSPTNDVSMSCIAGKNVTHVISMKADNIDGPTILTIRILYRRGRSYMEGLVVHKIYTVVPNITNLHEESSQSDTPIAAIVGGAVGALLEEVNQVETDFLGVAESVKNDIQRNKRNTLTGTADIERFVEQSTRGTNSYDVYVDDTMTQLIITVISTKGIHPLNVTKPSGIEGIDHTGHIIQRIDPTLLEPIVYRIDIYPDSGAKMYENSTLNITYTIQCYVTRSIKVNINDTMGLIQSPTNDVSMSCIAGKNVTHVISMKADNIDGPTILTIRILYRKRGVYTEDFVVHKTYTVIPNINNSREEDSNTSQSGTPIAAIVGGVVGALIGIYGTVSDDEPPNGGQQGDTNSNLVDIARFIDKSTHMRRYPVYVDDTMTRLIFQVTVEGPIPEFRITHPTDGKIQLQPVNEIGDTYNTTTYDIQIHSTDFGKWYFMNTIDHSPWNVTIQGESPVSIYHELFEVGTNITVDHRPYADTYYRLVVTVRGMSNVKTIDSNLNWYAVEKYQLIKILATNQTSINTFEAESTKVLFQPFYLKVVGKDKSDNTIQRINSQLIQPVLVSLDVPDYTGKKLTEYEDLNVTFTVTSHHSTAGHIEIEIEDTANFTKEPKAFNFTLTASENATDMFSMQLGSAGSSTIVTITSKFCTDASPCSLSDGPSVVRRFTVKTDDPSTPIGAIVGGVVGACAAGGGGAGSYLLVKMLKNRKLKIPNKVGNEETLSTTT
ncbi:hypothetical protein ACF0H5_012470 [Mactra antiquata]